MRLRRLFIFQVLLVSLAASPVSVLARDSDHDGIPDARDRCPDTAQLRLLPADFKYSAAVNPERLKPGSRSYPVDPYGCELDGDGDGVVNSRDYCPQDSKEAISMGVAENGCPRHSDADGTPDYRDRCPGTPANTKTDKDGCEAG